MTSGGLIDDMTLQSSQILIDEALTSTNLALDERLMTRLWYRSLGVLFWCVFDASISSV